MTVAAAPAAARPPSAPGLDEWKLGTTQTISTSLAIFQTNEAELLRHLDAGRKPPQALELRGARLAMNRYQLELTRLQHNYVAAACSLIDHTEAFCCEQFGRVWMKKEFSPRKKALEQNPYHGFFIGLRNFCLHVRHPRVACLNISSVDG